MSVTLRNHPDTAQHQKKSTVIEYAFENQQTTPGVSTKRRLLPKPGPVLASSTREPAASVVLPINSMGTAVPIVPKAQQASSIALLAPNQLIVPNQITVQAVTPTPRWRNISTSTFYRHKQEAKMQASGQLSRRKYIRKSYVYRCRKCGQPKTRETGHSIYKGYVYCPHSETEAKSRWLHKMQNKN